ncbi:Tetratricopeptide repeat (TPR)-like superfamily protein [Euphorbia peplus]|nr:Tetratricopeptide repeat (TPR)-like superfamily protein [Euphorbia peplus]
MSCCRLWRPINTFTIQFYHIRTYVREPFPNKLTQYLRRAQLIDSIRLHLRSNSPNSLPTLLNTRLLDSFVVSHAIRSSPNADSALTLTETLQKIPHFIHDQSTLHALGTLLAKSKRVSELRALVEEINAGRYDGVRVSFMNVMQWYAVCGDVEGVLDTWCQYRKSAERVCTESYNVVMSLFVEKEENLKAVEVFYRMIDEGAVPNSRSYTVVIEHLIMVGKLDSAIEVFCVLPFMRIKRTLKQFYVLIDAFVGVQRFEEVKWLLHEMREDGKIPSRAMLSALQKTREAGFVQETEEFIGEMFPDERIKSIGLCTESNEDYEDDNDDGYECAIDEEVQTDEVRLKPWLDPKALANALNKWSPEVVSTLEGANFVWTTRLACKILRNFRSPETAWNFFCWVAYQPGFTHDAYTVKRMMTLLARRGKVELVDELIDKVRSEGMRLPFSTLRLIIDFYGFSKNADAALKVFRDDRQLCGSITNFNMMLLYSSLLRTLTKCNRNSDAINVLEEMFLGGICPDIQTFTGLMHHFALQGDIKTVQKLFSMFRQSDVEPDAYMFKVLIEAYCKRERAALAWRIFEDMKNANLMPDAATKDLLVKSLWKEGKRKEAAIVEETCEDNNKSLPLALRGHMWAVSSADLTRVYDIYSNSLKANS